MRIRPSLVAALPVVVALYACGESKTIGPSAGGGGAAGAATGVGGNAGPSAVVMVTPAEVSVLSCSGQTTLDATVTGAADHGVSWSADPSVSLVTGSSTGGAGGSGDASGTGGGAGGTSLPVVTSTVTLAAPDTQGDIRVTATNVADPGAAASAVVHVRTALPGAKTVITAGDQPGDVPYATASARDRVYAAYVGSVAGAVSLRLARSEDRGKSFQPGVPLLLDAVPAGATLSCVSIAVDAGSLEGPGSSSSDRVYVAFRWSAGSGISLQNPAVQSDDAGMGIVVWERDKKSLRVLASGPALAAASCPDVASPAPNTVVVSLAGGSSGGVKIWSDPAAGQGFATGIDGPDGYLAAGETGALAVLDADVAQGGSRADGPESPTLFTDASGHLCVTYVGLTPKGASTPSSAPRVHCSSDRGLTFSPAVSLVAPIDPAAPRASAPTGAFSSTGGVAVTWSTQAEAGSSDAAGSLHVSTAPSSDQPFADAIVPLATDRMPAGAAARSPHVRFDGRDVLWLAYHAAAGDFAERLFVDKSCDGGATWSGGGLVNTDGTAGVDSATRAGLLSLSSWDNTTGAPTSPGMAMSAFGFGSEIRVYSLTP